MIMSPLGRLVFRRKLQKTGPASTLVRLITSRHVEDLQLIVEFALLLWLIGLLILLRHCHWSVSAAMNNTDIIKYFGALTAVLGAVLTWAYQTGSKRLGVVDLFACEIGAICRASLVTDFANLSVRQARSEQDSFEATPKPRQPDASDVFGLVSSIEPPKFTSAEHYTPVYDGTLSDLQPLEVSVVTSITEFYTYRKVMMDYLRRISDEKEEESRCHHRVMMIYMQFLMYESARRAIGQLTEFEPNREDSLIIILCSEIIVFGFLKSLKQLQNDFRGNRLRLREQGYRQVVAETYYKAMRAGDHPNWRKARTTASELERRYRSVFGVFPDYRENDLAPLGNKRPAVDRRNFEEMAT